MHKLQNRSSKKKTSRICELVAGGFSSSSSIRLYKPTICLVLPVPISIFPGSQYPFHKFPTFEHKLSSISAHDDGFKKWNFSRQVNSHHADAIYLLIEWFVVFYLKLVCDVWSKIMNEFPWCIGMGAFVEIWDLKFVIAYWFVHLDLLFRGFWNLPL